MLRQYEAPVCCLKGHTVLHQLRIHVCVGNLQTGVPGLDRFTEGLQLCLESLHQPAGGVLTEMILWVFTKTDLAKNMSVMDNHLSHKTGVSSPDRDWWSLCSTYKVSGLHAE